MKPNTSTGTRNTKQRQIIMDELMKLKTHPTADELYKIVRKKIPRISLATVYRNLELLAATGSVQKLCIGASQMRFDGNIENHPHARCMKCGCVRDIMSEPPVEVTGQIPTELDDFLIMDYRINFMGVCPTCQKK